MKVNWILKVQYFWLGWSLLSFENISCLTLTCFLPVFIWRSSFLWALPLDLCYLRYDPEIVPNKTESCNRKMGLASDSEFELWVVQFCCLGINVLCFYQSSLCAKLLKTSKSFRFQTVTTLQIWGVRCWSAIVRFLHYLFISEIYTPHLHWFQWNYSGVGGL